MGFGGLPLFLAWLTRVPTLGPVNLEVLLGIGCVLGASVLPVLHARMARAMPRRAGLLTVLLVLGLVPYVPVLLRLDLELVAMAILGLPSLFSPEPVRVPWLAAGPVLRALAVAGMVVGTTLAWTRGGAVSSAGERG